MPHPSKASRPVVSRVGTGQTTSTGQVTSAPPGVAAQEHLGNIELRADGPVARMAHGAELLRVAGFCGVPTPANVPMSAMRALMCMSQAAEEGLDTSAASGAIQRSSGAPLPDAIRARLETAFGHDFSHVRVHTDGAAAEASIDLNALAFTLGSHVFFGRGQFSPSSSDGLELIAHELMHVVQADEHRLPGGPSEGMDVSSPQDAHELDAVLTARDVANELLFGDLDHAETSAGVEEGGPVLIGSWLSNVHGSSVDLESRSNDPSGIRLPDPSTGPGSPLTQNALSGVGITFDQILQKEYAPEATGSPMASALGAFPPSSAIEGLMAGASHEANDGAGAAGLLAAHREPGASALELGPNAKEAVEEAKSRGGRPLAPAVQARIEHALGDVNLSAARVHADSAAARATAALHAEAFALGQDIFFAEGTYETRSSAGLQLLAHEAMHVVQFQEGRIPGSTGDGLGMTRPGDAVESEADRVSADIGQQFGSFQAAQETATSSGGVRSLGSGAVICSKPEQPGGGSAGKSSESATIPLTTELLSEAWKGALGCTPLFTAVRWLASGLRYFGITDIQSVAFGVTVEVNAVAGLVGGHKGLNVEFFFSPTGELQSAKVYGFSDEGELASLKGKYTLEEYLRQTLPHAEDPSVIGLSVGASAGVSLGLLFRGGPIGDVAKTWEGDFLNIFGEAVFGISLSFDQQIFEGNGGWVVLQFGAGPQIGAGYSNTTYTAFELGPDILEQLFIQIPGEILEEFSTEQVEPIELLPEM